MKVSNWDDRAACLETQGSSQPSWSFAFSLLSASVRDLGACKADTVGHYMGTHVKLRLVLL